MYERIAELRKEILDLTEGANDRKHLMMLDSIDKDRKSVVWEWV